MEQNASPVSVPNADPPSGTLLVLTASNDSSVPGEQYFNVFPPLMTVAPEQRQTLFPMVSTATVTGKQPDAVLKWSGPPTLSLLTVEPGQSVDSATPNAVTLGSTATIDWKADAFVVTTTPGTGNTIKLTFNPGIPASSSVGLAIGPGKILVPIVGNGLVMTPNLAPTVMVQFGTAWQPGSPSFTDLSALTPVTFMGTKAAIVVGPDNLIIQTA